MVMDVMDWLGEIGGIAELMGRCAIFMFGGYLTFN